MKIEDAQKLKHGDRVVCPADRGEPSYTGAVSGELHRVALINTTANGDQYVWVSVKGFGKKSVWPSNRLGRA